MHSNAGSANIVRPVIDLAKALGLPIIAEGIEHRYAREEAHSPRRRSQAETPKPLADAGQIFQTLLPAGLRREWGKSA